MMKHATPIVTVLALLAGSAAHAATIAARDTDGDGKNEFVLENAALRLVIDPQFGAQGVTLFRKDIGVDCALAGGKDGGFFADHDFRQSFPGEFFRAEYACTILNRGPDEVTLRCVRTAAGKWQAQSEPSLAGLVLQRDITLVGDRPVVRIDVRFHNPTDTGKFVAYWFQSIGTSAGRRDRDRFFRPGTGMIDRAAGAEGDWLYTPTAGWSARIDPQRRVGIAYLMDYNYLKTLYNCRRFTTEWMYDPVPIPAGRSWRTRIWMVLFGGLEAVTHASEQVIVDSRFQKRGRSVDLVHRLVAGPECAGPLKLAGTLTNRGTGEGVTMRFSTTLARMVPVQNKEAWKTFPLPQVTLGEPGPVALEARQPVPPKAGEGLFVAEVRATLGNRAERFRAVGVCGDTKLTYALQPPPKKKVFLKPKKIERITDEVLDVLLVCEEAMLPRWQFEPVIRSIDAKARVRTSRISLQTWKGHAELSYLPISYDEMLRYDVVVLQAGDLSAVGDFGKTLLADYLKAGGGVVMLGGYFSFGKGRYDPDGDLERRLPFEPAGPFDFKKAAYPAVRVTAPHPVLVGCDWSAAPEVPFYHALKVRPTRRVVLQVDGAPLLILDEPPGGGRVVVLAGTVLGARPTARAFWRWKGYRTFMANLLRWAGRVGMTDQPGPEPTAPSQRRNLLRNGRFEQGLKHWSPNIGYPPLMKVVPEGPEGRPVLRIQPARTVPPPSGVQVSGAVIQGFPFTPARRYRISALARGVGRFSFYVYEYDARTFASSAVSPPQRLTSEWQTFTFDYAATKADILRASLAIHVGEASVAYLTDVSVQVIE